jgi:hypothetical protein
MRPWYTIPQICPDGNLEYRGRGAKEEQRGDRSRLSNGQAAKKSARSQVCSASDPAVAITFKKNKNMMMCVSIRTGVLDHKPDYI